MQFYISWFFKLAEQTEYGWWLRNTPDGLPIISQDAYFWRCLEIICVTLGEMIAEERAKE